MVQAEKGYPSEAFTNLPRVEQELQGVVAALQQMFRPHLEFLRASHKYFQGNAPKIVELTGTDHLRHDVQRYENEGREGFSFYSESEDLSQRKTVNLRVDKGFGRIERAEVNDDQEVNGHTTKFWTAIDATEGLAIEQEVSPIPAKVDADVESKQRFRLDTNRQRSWQHLCGLSMGKNTN